MKRTKHLETILSIVLGLAVVFLLSKNKYLPLAIAIISAIGLLSNHLTEKIHWLWMKLAAIIGAITSKVLLTIIFYTLLFPLAAVSKIFSKRNPLQLRKTKDKTYFTARNHLYVGEDLENLW